MLILTEFVTDGMDSGASNGGYLELDAESPDDEPNGPELEKWILTAIEEWQDKAPSDDRHKWMQRI